MLRLKTRRLVFRNVATTAVMYTTTTKGTMGEDRIEDKGAKNDQRSTNGDRGARTHGETRNCIDEAEKGMMKIRNDRENNTQGKEMEKFHEHVRT